MALARGLKFYVRWIPSEFNSADIGSREHNDKGSGVGSHLLNIFSEGRNVMYLPPCFIGFSLRIFAVPCAF